MKVFDIELHDKEKLALKTRQHWVLLLWPTLRFLVLAAAAAIPADYYFESFSGNLTAFLLYLVVVLLFFNSWVHDFLEWYLNIYVVTNQRVINVTHESIFKRQTTEAPLFKIQDVTHRTLGFVSMLFNYGDVIAQTAGHKTLIHFRLVPQPRRIHRILANLIAQNHKDNMSQKEWSL